MNKQPQTCKDPRAAFMDALMAEGFKVPNQILIGKLVRLDGTDDKRGKKSAWYIYNEIEDTYSSGHVIGVANYGDWKMDINKSWCSRSESQMTNPEERAAFNEKHRKMRQQYEQEKAEKQNAAAEDAFNIWSSSDHARNEHPYLQVKGVKAYQGVKVASEGRLLIPIAYDAKISSLQYINESGDKRFLTGGRLKGGWFIIEGSEDTVYVAEGYSTGASVHEATGSTVYVAFNAGNLYEVASYVKKTWPHSRIIIAGDDDTNAAGNPGRTKADQAAQALRIECVFPEGFNDFNDMHKELGIKSLKKYLCPQDVEHYEENLKNRQNCIIRPAGLMGEIYDYYNAISGCTSSEYFGHMA